MVVAIKPAACERDNPPIVLPMVEITREIHTLYLSSFVRQHYMKGGGGKDYETLIDPVLLLYGPLKMSCPKNIPLDEIWVLFWLNFALTF